MPKKSRTRASNGMGSIRQRGDGRWEARYTTPSGAQKSVYGKTEKEVTAKLRTQLHDIDAGRWREPSRMTIDEIVKPLSRRFLAMHSGFYLWAFHSLAIAGRRPV